MTAAEILLTLTSSVIGGLLVAVLNILYSRKKTSLEVAKLELEIRTLSAQLKDDIGKLAATIGEANYAVVYSSQTADLSHYTTRETSVESDPKKEIARGTFTVKDGVLCLERKNTGGRFQVYLREYYAKGNRTEYLPKNIAIDGQRKLKVSLDAKTSGGSHRLHVVVKKRSDQGDWLASQSLEVDETEYCSFEFVLRFTPNEDCIVRLEDNRVVKTGSLYIRNFVVAERMD